jgi:cystathionine beta-lyase
VRASQDKEDNLFRYEFDVEDFEKKMNEQKPRLIILSNPHNPAGKIFSRMEL